VALLVGLAAGCATTINDILGQKASGLAQSNPVPPDRAWQIAYAVLEERGNQTREFSTRLVKAGPISSWMEGSRRGP
jgi:hypothetical protein